MLSLARCRWASRWAHHWQAEFFRNKSVNQAIAQADETAAPPRISRWIISPAWDLILFIATPLLILPTLWLSRQSFSPDAIYGFVAAFGASGHHTRPAPPSPLHSHMPPGVLAGTERLTPPPGATRSANPLVASRAARKRGRTRIVPRPHLFAPAEMRARGRGSNECMHYS